MKRILLALLLSSCTLTAKPDAQSVDVINRQGITVQMIVNYIADLQAKGILPNADELKKAEVKK